MFDPYGGHKDILRFEAELLHAMYEKGDGLVCGAVPDLLESERRASEASWKDVAITYPHV